MFKKSILSVAFCLITLSIWAQSSNAILFTENGEKFTAILNGVRQNDKPETNVKITGLNAEFYKLKVIFDNQALGEKNFNLAIELGNETNYCIKKNNKGEYVIRFISSVPVAQAPASPATQQVIVYNANPAATPVESTVVHQQTTTTTTSGQGNPDNVNINMGINVNGSGGGINLNVSGVGMETESSSTSIHTTTTTTTTTSNTNFNTPPPPPPAPIVYLPGYNGPIGCPIPMSPNDFSALKSTITSKTFEETRLTIAKQVVGDRCLITDQVKDLLQAFTFEDSKLDLAKFAYGRTYDVGNYFKVNDVFTFESSIEELNDYIQSRR